MSPVNHFKVNFPNSDRYTYEKIHELYAIHTLSSRNIILPNISEELFNTLRPAF